MSVVSSLVSSFPVGAGLQPPFCSASGTAAVHAEIALLVTPKENEAGSEKSWTLTVPARASNAPNRARLSPTSKARSIQSDQL
jgi:hypothetical protein